MEISGMDIKEFQINGAISYAERKSTGAVREVFVNLLNGYSVHRNGALLIKKLKTIERIAGKIREYLETECTQNT
jgi:hypothetical protein